MKDIYCHELFNLGKSITEHFLIRNIFQGKKGCSFFMLEVFVRTWRKTKPKSIYQFLKLLVFKISSHRIFYKFFHKVTKCNIIVLFFFFRLDTWITLITFVLFFKSCIIHLIGRLIEISPSDYWKLIEQVTTAFHSWILRVFTNAALLLCQWKEKPLLCSNMLSILLTLFLSVLSLAFFSSVYLTVS